MATETPAALAVETSDNRKLGPVSATYASQASCPGDCPFRAAGCYAEFGNVGHHTRRLNRSAARTPLAVAREEARAIDGLTGDRPLRLHVVDDCRTDAAARTVGAAVTRYARRGGRPAAGGRKAAWTYSHAWREVRRESWGPDVAVLASVEAPGAAREAMDAGYAAAIVVGQFERDSAYLLGGVTVLPCPHQTAAVTCRECGLCRDDARLREAGIVIGFEAHGATAGRIQERLRSLDVVS
jgi:hypothetical protein